MVNRQTRPGLHVDALVLSDIDGAPIAQSPANFSIVGELYEWQGRAVLPTNDQLMAATNSAGWTLVVDGYQLTVT